MMKIIIFETRILNINVCVCKNKLDEKQKQNKNENCAEIAKNRKNWKKSEEN